MNLKAIRKLKKELYAIPRKNIDIEIIMQNQEFHLFGSHIPDKMAEDIYQHFTGEHKELKKSVKLKNINPKDLLEFGIYYLTDPDGNRVIIWDDIGIYEGDEDLVINDIDNILR